MTNIHVRPRFRRASPVPALRPLVACLALALSTGASSVESSSSGLAPLERPTPRPGHQPLLRVAPSAVKTHFVTTCDDTLVLPTCDGIDDGTLRKAFACAGNNDTIDLSQLQCSKITLGAALVSPAVSLTLVGPATGTLTLDAGGQSRVLVHNGGADDTLYVNRLTLASGHYEKPDAVGGGTGGCIYSSGNVVLNFSTVTSCYASAGNADATGGAIYAKHAVGLYRSTVSGSTVHGNGFPFAPFAIGGGIYADVIDLNQSTVSGNTAASATIYAFGGGIAANLIYASSSTVSGNKANQAAGIDGNHVYLTDSTVSGNQTPVNGRWGGVYAGLTARIIGSTIAGNSSGGQVAAGLFVPEPAVSEIESSIIAGNKADGVELDVGSNNDRTMPGHNNLIMAHQARMTVPDDTLTDDPLLGLLQDNGGPTQTLALLPGSPAIDHGSNTGGLPFDQRGRPREIGGLPDIGAYEFDPDSIFSTGFDP